MHEVTEELSEQERLAVKVVNDLVIAAETRDPRNVIALVTDDVIFKGASNTPEINGAQDLLKELNHFMELPIAEKLTFAKQIDRYHAIGGETGTVVMAWRVDGITLNGKRETVPIVAVVWVEGDKVRAWYDLPLVNDPDGTNWGLELVNADSATSAAGPDANGGLATPAEIVAEKEQAAIRMVNDFFAAWPSRDAERIGSFVTEDTVFKATPKSAEDIGKAAFVAETQRFMDMEMTSRLKFADAPSRIYAMGGRIGTVVVALRTDRLTQGDKVIEVPLVGAFWVVDEGIKDWYDFPLVNNLGSAEGESW